MNDKTPQNRDRRSGAIRHRTEPETLIECVREQPPRIMPVECDAICIDIQYGPGFGGSRKVYIKFRIIGRLYEDTELWMACPLHEKLTPRCKLFKQWTLAIGRPPKKGERFSEEVFMNRAFRIKVRTVCNDERGQALPPELQYSVVDSILAPLDGGLMAWKR